MILGENRQAVIENIKNAAACGDFYRKVEIGDPVLSSGETKEITDHFLSCRKTAGYRFRSFLARTAANIATAFVNRNTAVIGDVDPEILKNGVIITSNHFSPLENTVIRHYILKKGFDRLHIVSQASNFAMKGAVGFLMNYADTMPISEDARYLARDFMDVLKETIDRREAVLIYPEQEMWFHYRKPRPPKRGAYHFAVKLNCPILSCFVEIVDLPEMDTDAFHKVKYRLHILGVLYPDKSKGSRESSEEMCRQDYALKKAAYEKAYGRPLSYDFEPCDIAGWVWDEG